MTNVIINKEKVKISKNKSKNVNVYRMYNFYQNAKVLPNFTQCFIQNSLVHCVNVHNTFSSTLGTWVINVSKRDQKRVDPEINVKFHEPLVHTGRVRRNELCFYCAYFGTQGPQEAW